MMLKSSASCGCFSRWTFGGSESRSVDDGVGSDVVGTKDDVVKPQDAYIRKALTPIRSEPQEANKAFRCVQRRG